MKYMHLYIQTCPVAGGGGGHIEYASPPPPLRTGRFGFLFLFYCIILLLFALF